MSSEKYTSLIEFRVLGSKILTNTKTIFNANINVNVKVDTYKDKKKNIWYLVLQNA